MAIKKECAAAARTRSATGCEQFAALVFLQQMSGGLVLVGDNSQISNGSCASESLGSPSRSSVSAASFISSYIARTSTAAVFQSPAVPPDLRRFRASSRGPRTSNSILSNSSFKTALIGRANSQDESDFSLSASRV